MREQYAVRAIIDNFVVRSGSFEDYAKHSREKSLRELGYEYAKRYAEKEERFIYKNLKTGEIEHHDKETNKKWLEPIGIEYIYTIRPEGD